MAKNHGNPPPVVGMAAAIGEAIARRNAERETPAANWRATGEPDPHLTRYDCERAQLAGGHLTDDEVAHMVGMLDRNSLDHEGVLAVAKDRIRWLSRALIAATQRGG